MLVSTNQLVDKELYDLFVYYLDAFPSTVEMYSKCLKYFFDFLKENKIKKPDRKDVLDFREKLVINGKKPTTIQNYINAVKAFFRWTHQERLYPNIAERVKVPKLDPGYKKDYLTSTQVKEVLANIDINSERGARDYAMLLLMVTDGLRSMEVSKANIEDIRNIGDNTVLYVQGKGKNDKNDFVKLTPPVEKAIRTYLKYRPSASDDEPLFSSTSNHNFGLRLTPKSISTVAKKAMVSVGYDSPRLTAHSFRHTAVTLSLIAGRGLTEVQQFARHSNVSSTLIYDHSLEKIKNGCSETISRMIFDENLS